MCRPFASIDSRSSVACAGRQVRDVDVGRARVAAARSGCAAASRRSRCSRSRSRRSSRRRPPAASRGTARSASRASSGGLRRNGSRWLGAGRSTETQRALASAASDGVPDEHLVVAVGERGIAGAGGDRPGYHVRVDGTEMGAEGVEESFDVPTRQGGCRLAGRTHERRVSDEDLVRSIAVADPRLVGLLGVPGQGRLGPIDLVLERVLPAGADLGDADGASGAAIEAKQDLGGVLGRDRTLDSIGGSLGREGLDRTLGLVAGRR